MYTTKLLASELNRLVTDFPLDGCHLIANGGISIFSTKEWHDWKEYVIYNI